MPKCQLCGHQLKGILSINDNELGYQCRLCFEFHSWIDGVLIKKGGDKK